MSNFIPEKYKDDPDALAKACAEQMCTEDLASRKLGIELKSMAAGKVSMSMTVRQDMVNGHGICHGGFIFTLADSTFAFTCNGRNQVAVAADCVIDFVRPALLDDELTAYGILRHAGRTTGLCEIEVLDQKNRAVAFFRGRYQNLDKAILPEDKS